MLHLIGTIIIGFVAGVRPGAGLVLDLVGQERYQFDIWGDTVNVRDERPGSVAVTKEIFEQVAAAFDGELLGELNVKGKGAISVFGLRTRKK